MVVLKGIPSVLSPELLYALAKMGHGDELGMIYSSIRVIHVLWWLQPVVFELHGVRKLIYVNSETNFMFYHLQYLQMLISLRLLFVPVVQKRSELMVW